MLEEQLNNRKGELEKIDSLEEKLAAELDTLADSSNKLRAELTTFQDLDNVYASGQEREVQLKEQQASLQARVDMLEALAASKETQVQAAANDLMVRSGPLSCAEYLTTAPSATLCVSLRALTSSSLLQAASWFQDFHRVEEQLRKVSGEAFHLNESIEQRKCESNCRPIIESIEALLPALSQEVLRAV